jgi:DNA-binding transcriptional MerR regulator
VSLRVEQIARATGVPAHTVRYYVRRKLLRPRRNARNGYHEFTPGDARVLAFIRRAQALGFALSEIATILEKSRRRESPCPMVRDIVRRRLDEFGVELDELVEMRGRMQGALAKWRRMRDGVPTGHEICRLIEAVGA